MSELLWVAIGLGIIAGCYWLAQRVIGHLYGSNLEKELQDVADAVEQAFDDAIDEIEEEIEELLAQLPTVSQMKRMTKDKLEELGRELGIELDKRKTKDNMIKDLQDKAGK